MAHAERETAAQKETAEEPEQTRSQRREADLLAARAALTPLGRTSDRRRS